ncbi:MAG: hypothetical protein ACI94Y_000513 [Maribacter sp.]|jgi:hypothetical protein
MRCVNFDWISLDIWRKCKSEVQPRTSKIRFFVSVFLFLIITSFLACNSSSIVEDNRIIFSDINTGKEAITKDEIEDFFQDISDEDMRLQVGMDFILSLPKLKEKYTNSLKSSILLFNRKDKKKINQIFNEITPLINKINPSILSDSIRLIKIEPNLYGKGVFYTRENAIIIPADMLDDYNEKVFKDIIIHEIFHIYSRLNKKEKRKELYDLIQFKKIENELLIPHELNNKILLNPDGLEKEWYIESRVGDKNHQLIPLLISISDQVDSDNYMANLELRFYAVQQNENLYSLSEDKYFLIEAIPDFYTQVGDNTTYILHPDEILAENFVIAVLAQENPTILKSLSPQGKQLVLSLIEILKN